MPNELSSPVLVAQETPELAAAKGCETLCLHVSADSASADAATTGNRGGQASVRFPLLACDDYEPHTFDYTLRYGVEVMQRSLVMQLMRGRVGVGAC